jgi:group I intron endonuclease
MHIYCLINTITGKIYIGKSERSGEMRAKEHFNFALSGKTYCPHLYSAIRNYGQAVFQFCLISDFVGSKEELNAQEKYFIEKYQANNPKFGYNLTAGGEGLSNPSLETRQKLRLAQIGRKQDPEIVAKRTRVHVGNTYNLNRIQSQEERKVRSNSSPHKGVPLSDEHRQHLSQSNTGKGGKLSALGKKWVHDLKSGETRLVLPEEVSSLVEAGWTLGRKKWGLGNG